MPLDLKAVEKLLAASGVREWVAGPATGGDSGDAAAAATSPPPLCCVWPVPAEPADQGQARHHQQQHQQQQQQQPGQHQRQHSHQQEQPGQRRAQQGPPPPKQPRLQHREERPTQQQACSKEATLRSFASELTRVLLARLAAIHKEEAARSGAFMVEPGEGLVKHCLSTEWLLRTDMETLCRLLQGEQHHWRLHSEHYP